MTEPPMDSKVETLLWIIVFLGVVGFGSYIANRLSPTTDTVGRVNVIIVLATGLVLIWYTVETKRLRAEAQKQVLETQRQTEIQQRPFVILDVYSTNDENEPYKIRVKNLGNGTATNVKIKDIEEVSTGSTYYFPNSVPILSAGECCPIECLHIQYRGGNQNDQVILSLRNLYYADTQETLAVMIEFKNIEGQSYFVKETVSRNGLDFGFGKI